MLDMQLSDRARAQHAGGPGVNSKHTDKQLNPNMNLCNQLYLALYNTGLLFDLAYKLVFV